MESWYFPRHSARGDKRPDPFREAVDVILNREEWMRLEKNLEKYTGVWVTYLDPEPKLKRIEVVMRRHHAIKDFGRRECSLGMMLRHDEEYAALMAYFVNKSGRALTQAGYDPKRGDGVGVCFTSARRGFMMYSVGGLVQPERDPNEDARRAAEAAGRTLEPVTLDEMMIWLGVVVIAIALIFWLLHWLF